MLISRRISLALGGVVTSGALALTGLSAASAFAGPAVTVRVVGESAMLPLTPVTLEKPEPVSGCPANSANAAINLAVKGNWDHGDEGGSKGDFTETILGETHAFTDFDTWAVWIDDKWGGGICEDLLKEGDEVLLIADHEPEPGEPTVLPLVLSGAPSSVVAGVPFNITVDAIHTRAGTFPEVGEGAPKPQPGATVTGSTATTNASGVATLTFASPGTYTVTASRTGDAPSAPVTVCVRNSGESGCGIQVPAGSSGSSSSSSPGTHGTSGVLGTRSGSLAIAAKAEGLIEGHVYKPGGAPDLLRGTIAAQGGLQDVKLRLTRAYRHLGKRSCSYYDGLDDRFRAMRCGAGNGRYFSIGAHSSFSYLLPAKLAPGRYVFDIEATDAAGDQTKLLHGVSRVVFYVS